MSTTRVPLWRDVRVLRWAGQLAIVAVVAAAIAWLYGNYTENASRLNIPTNFDFLDNPTAFEITGNSLSQNAPVRDALYQGFLNTLRVSIAGIIAATLLGTLIGVARLSNNWIVNRLAAVYVEAVRNIPLALFLIFGLLVVVLGVFPPITDAWDIVGLMIVSNRGIAMPWYDDGAGWLLLGAMIVGIIAWWGVARWRNSVA
ncbi:MAG: ABC transporter permease subunit, partial [Actinomycetota bacterium]